MTHVLEQSPASQYKGDPGPQGTEGDSEAGTPRLKPVHAGGDVVLFSVHPYGQ